MAQEDFSTDFQDGGSVLVVAGEVDETAAPALRDEIAQRSNEFSQPLVIDLSGVTYLPSIAIGVLATTRQRALTTGAAIELVAAEGSIAQRVLSVCALPYRTAV